MKAQSGQHDECLEFLSRLLHEERVFTAAYGRLIESASDAHDVASLQSTKLRHEELILAVAERIRRAGGDAHRAPMDAPRSLAAEILELAHACPDVRLLKEVEEIGIHECEEALRSLSFSEEAQAFVRNTVLRAKWDNVEALDRLILRRVA